MTFNLDEYVDVAERIRIFYERHPAGSLKTGSPPQFVETAGKAFVVYHAQAFRSAEDPCPADGWAWEPVPGPTQFTRDSELQNAETAAWGRAIVALGFETKKIASRQEVQNRTGSAPDVGSTAEPTGASPDSAPASGAELNPAAKAQAAAEAAKARRAPADDGHPANVAIHFGKNNGITLGELKPRQLEWYAHVWEPNDRPEDRRLQMAAQVLLAGGGAKEMAEAERDDEIPF